jgi:hypothetical protein
MAAVGRFFHFRIWVHLGSTIGNSPSSNLASIVTVVQPAFPVSGRGNDERQLEKGAGFPGVPWIVVDVPELGIAVERSIQEPGNCVTDRRRECRSWRDAPQEPDGGTLPLLRSAAGSC